LLTFKAQTELAEAMAQMMRSCLLAATRSWSVAALRGLSLWSDVMPGPGVRESENGTAAPGPYASYRSGGGHATTQVIVGRD
jgi:hypothetical protein